MVNQKIPPEERLLRLIESGEKNEPLKHPARKTSFLDARTWGRRFFSRNSSTGLSSFPKGVIPEFKLEWVNRVLIVLLIVVLGGIVSDAHNKTRAFPKNLIDSTEIPKTTMAEEPVESVRTVSLRPLEDYLKEAERRSLFLPAPPPKPEKPVAKNETPPPLKLQAPDPSAILREKVQPLKLVGISWGNKPIAMIENKVTNETSFIKVGESINDVTVKAILKDRAILSYGDAEYDLF